MQQSRYKADRHHYEKEQSDKVAVQIGITARRSRAQIGITARRSRATR